MRLSRAPSVSTIASVVQGVYCMGTVLLGRQCFRLERLGLTGNNRDHTDLINPSDIWWLRYGFWGLTK